MIDWNKYYPILQRSEFACSCCGEENMQPKFMDALYDLRIDLKTPFNITSGYRCDAHEKQVGGSGSNHPKGLAVDIVTARHIMSQIVTRGESYGFTGIGVALHGSGKFIHLDMSHQNMTVWSY
ncbi:D-Ala-D-Ala carboxypeptidase family metallohydrolase [bacterium]|nr:D-Ala-D-Ala carboxypeptidase family metallohydrolase [bacterium]